MVRNKPNLKICRHWFYEDFIREQNTKLPSLPLKKFSEMLFHACPLLQQWSHAHEEIYHNFMQYKTKVPVCGAIMLNDAMDKVCIFWKSSVLCSDPEIMLSVSSSKVGNRHQGGGFQKER
jgi:hypothetical protein